MTQAAKAVLCRNICSPYHLLSFAFSSEIPQDPRNPKWHLRAIRMSIFHNTATKEYPWRPFWLSFLMKTRTSRERRGNGARTSLSQCSVIWGLCCRSKSHSLSEKAVSQECTRLKCMYALFLGFQNFAGAPSLKKTCLNSSSIFLPALGKMLLSKCLLNFFGFIYEVDDSEFLPSLRTLSKWVSVLLTPLLIL